ncbi:hypothetical protein K435DRAFT_855582 [Dendrothele bispora CBS 962.96]|uniref:Uncharacterized protein n=1 Tax=Dendrothele bispora (strain CBS 962.96) TaxID=1314807 RepID=A0A4S8MBD2_DENBC|nr:hypothetical protein K435DRAFT_855582 [Dendrothele bispora CBS 962.96]
MGQTHLPTGAKVFSKPLRPAARGAGSSAGGAHKRRTPTLRKNRGSNAGRPYSQPTSQTDFDGSHGSSADTNNYNGFQRSSGNSGGDTEQYNQMISDGTRRNTDSQMIADDRLSNPTNTEHYNGPPRHFGDINGGYTEQDKRRIDRNIEDVEIYYKVYNNDNQGDWKTFLAGGGLATTAFYAGHTTAGVEEPFIPTNNEIAIIYPQYTLDLVHPVVVSFVVLHLVLMNLFSLVRQRLVASITE